MEPESSRPAKVVTFRGRSSAQERDSGNSQGFLCVQIQQSSIVLHLLWSTETFEACAGLDKLEAAHFQSFSSHPSPSLKCVCWRTQLLILQSHLESHCPFPTAPLAAPHPFESDQGGLPKTPKTSGALKRGKFKIIVLMLALRTG